MKKKGGVFRKITSVLVALMMVLSTIAISPMKANAEEKEIGGYITMSVERFTLGQGYIIEPIKVPFYKGENGAQVLLREFKKRGIENRQTGQAGDESGIIGNSFYLSYIRDGGVDEKDPNKARIPQYILDKIAEDGGDDPYGREEDDWLGEFDYTMMSGWMYCVNNDFPGFGASNYHPQDGDVMRWQFTVWGYGTDLGAVSSWSGPGFCTVANKDELTNAIAEVNSAENKDQLLKNNAVKTAYDRAYKVMENMLINKKEVTRAAEALNDAVEEVNNPKIEVSFNADNGTEVVKQQIKKGEGLQAEPQAPIKDGYIFVGWYTDTNDITTEYKSGQKYDENTTYKAKYAHVQMLGAQAKSVVAGKSGIRFGTKLYNDGDKIVEKGTLILPMNLLLEGNSLNVDTPKVIKSVAKTLYEENKDENYVTYLGTLVNIPESQFGRQITASAYVIYEDATGHQYTVYSPDARGSVSINDLLK